MKKIISIAFAILSIIIFSSCSYYDELIILNWQDYLSADLITKFEEENNCIVTELTTSSNENMYNDILNRRVPYDLVIPSDYMIDKLYKNGLLKEIDFSKLENYSSDMFVKELSILMNDEQNRHYKNYYIPYFWGSLGIMYSTKNIPNIEEIVKEYGWAVFFEDVLPANTKVAMYDSSRDAFAAAELYLGYSLNTKDEEKLNECANLIASRKFSKWGTDDLKIDVSAGNTDIALVYSGDFFDAYYADVELGKDIDYGIYAPMNNNVFYDGLVIPITSEETELAYKFIDFILDEENNYINTEAIGYCPTLQSVYDEIFSSEDWEDVTSIDAYNPALILQNETGHAEVYLDLGDETYRIIENLYNNKIRFGN